MKPCKKQFIERLTKLSYHAHQLEFLPDKDKQYLDMLMNRNNEQFLYEKQGTKNPESD